MTALLKAEGLHAAGKDAEQGQDDRNEDGVAVDDDGAGALAAVVFWCLPLLRYSGVLPIVLVVYSTLVVLSQLSIAEGSSAKDSDSTQQATKSQAEVDSCRCFFRMGVAHQAATCAGQIRSRLFSGLL